MAFLTFPDRMQAVQTRIRCAPPLTWTRIFWRFGSQRLLLTLCAWLTRLPTMGPFPQTSQRFATTQFP